jgi:phosphoribosylformylglycinamidine synthase
MVNLISVEKAHTSTCSLMAWGYNPYIAEASPYHSAYLAVVESVSKLIATGASFRDVYLTFQEYFEKPMGDPKRWGKPMAAVLGAFKAQKDLGVGAIGGKDSMSGTFEHLDVPPTLISFAVTTGQISDVISPEFKSAGHKVIWLRPTLTAEGLPEPASLRAVFDQATALMRAGKVAAAYTPGFGGAAEAVLKMAVGNGIGFRFADSLTLSELFGYCYGSILLEVTEDVPGTVLGETTADGLLSYGGSQVALDALQKQYEDKLESVYPCNISHTPREIPAFTTEAHSWPKAKASCAKPKALIPVFPGNNCEYDTAKALARAGAEPEIIVIRNLTPDAVRESVEYFAKQLQSAQIVFIPGGFSGGDEPDGSGKFITAFFRNGAIKDAVNDLLRQRDGLMAGICNGFQALIKLGLVPYGEIIDTDANCPTLTFNSIGRHQSRLVRTRVASNQSPWLMKTKPGEVYTVPISHGEGRFYASDDLIRQLAANGQIATQYVDLSGKPSFDVAFNPNDSAFAVEGITSPDGRVLGKMGHSERIGAGLYRNVPGQYDMGLFESAVEYFK